MNEDQRSEGFENMNNGLNQAQDQQVLAEPDEQNIMVGMALMPTLQQDTASRVWEEARTKEATKLWDKFFSKGNPGDFIVKIPTNWSYFFTSMLLSLETFDWATKFLSSTAIAQISNSQGNISFSIPKQCPVIKKICVLSSENVSTEAGSSMGQDSGKNKGVLIQEIEEIGTPYKKRRATRG